MDHITDKYIRFDWAIKRLLRQKANFGVLEGFLTVFLGETVKIEEILESEGNQDAQDDKFNRVDIKAKNNKGEIIIVDIHNVRMPYYYERRYFEWSGSIFQHLNIEATSCQKAYSFSILLYGVRKEDPSIYEPLTRIGNIPIERYIINANQTDKEASIEVKEWLRYLGNGKIDDQTEVPGLKEAKEKLSFETMSVADYRKYENYLSKVMYQNDIFEAAREEGRAEGETEGQKLTTARLMLEDGEPIEKIIRYTGLVRDQIEKAKK